jgi:hypothetical protein
MLKNDFIARAPTNTRNIYKNVIDNLETELKSKFKTKPIDTYIIQARI